MPKKEELILENELLRRKLALAEAWMRREIVHHQKTIGEGEVRKSQRKKLDNILERESVDIITRRIESYFGSVLERAPAHTLEHLIDAEIYWQTLQRFPTLDALPVVSSYQKVLDAFFERIIDGFRDSSTEKGGLGGAGSNRKSSTITTSRGYSAPGGLSALDKDIENVLTKKYSLSLGRWYQFFSSIREGSEPRGYREDRLLEYLTEYHEDLLETCVMDPFFAGFSELISLEVFGRKRHDTKISYADARRTREILVGEYTGDGIIKGLFI